MQELGPCHPNRHLVYWPAAQQSLHAQKPWTCRRLQRQHQHQVQSALLPHVLLLLLLRRQLPQWVLLLEAAPGHLLNTQRQHREQQTVLLLPLLLLQAPQA